MNSKRLFPRVRLAAAICGALALLNLNLLAQSSPATGPQILSGTTLPSYNYDPKTAVDASGNIYVTGTTYSGYAMRTIVTKLDPSSQTVLYTIELPESSVSPIVIGADGNAWVGADRILYKLDPNGNILLRKDADIDLIIELAIGPQGDVYAVSQTRGGCVSQYDGDCFGSDVIVAKFDPNTAVYSQAITLGGRNNEGPHAIAVAPDGRVFVAGYTYSTDFPVTANALMHDINGSNNPNAFFAAFDRDLYNTVYATYIHGTYSGEAWGVVAAADGSVYVTADVDDSPLLPPGGGALIAKFDTAFNILAMLRLRGSVADLAFDSTGHLLAAGGTGAGNIEAGALPVARVVGTAAPGVDVAYLAKFNDDMSGIDALYYLGTHAASYGLAAGADGRAVVAGYIDAAYGGTLSSPVVLSNPPTWDDVQTSFVSSVDITIATGNTSSGANVGVAASDPATTVTFANVSGPGTTTLEPVNPGALNLSLPGAFAISNSVTAYEIHTTATVSAPITVCLNASSLSAADLATATILHGVGGQWVAEPTTNAGNGQLCAAVSSLSPFAVGVRADGDAPQISCQQADGVWHAQNVALSCMSSDVGTGLANVADAQFTLTTSVAAGTEMAGAATGTRQVCDRAGNCATAGPIAGNLVDMKAPAITIASPTTRGYVLNEAATAQYSCADAGSGASCTGTAANGAALNTAAVGAKTFTVAAKDAVTNASTASVSYTVGYAVKVLFDRNIVYKRGSVVPIVLQLADANGANVSATTIALTGMTLNGKPATAAQQLKFVALLRSYNVNLNTTGFAAGTYTVAFKAGADPAIHTVTFAVK